MQTQRKVLITFISLILVFSVFLAACTKSPVEVVNSANPSVEPTNSSVESATPSVSPTGESATPSVSPTGESATPSVSPTGESATPTVSPTGESAAPTVAPTEAPAPTVKPGKPVTITVSWWGTDTRNKALTASLKLFQKKYPWITVKGTGQGWDGYHDKLIVRLASKKAPDLFAYSTSYIEQFSKGGLVVNMNDYPGALPYLPKITDFTGQYLRDGKLYGAPAGKIYGALIFDKTLFDAAKVPYPTNDETTVSLFAKLALIHKNNPKIWGEPTGLPESFLDQMGGTTLLKYSNGIPSISIDPVKAKKFLDFVEKQWAAGTSPGPVVEQIGISNGNAATAGTNIAGIEGAIASTKHELGFIDNPRRFDSNSPKVVGPPGAPAFWGIPTASEHKDEALLLLNFLQTDKDAIKEIGLNYGTPVIPEVFDYLSSEIKPGTPDAISMNIAKNHVPPGYTVAKPGPLVPAGWGEAQAAFQVVLQKYAQGMIKQQEFVTETVKMMNEKFAAANKK
jgi:multiple sugar transport system substrate-binding protein